MRQAKSRDRVIEQQKKGKTKKERDEAKHHTCILERERNSICRSDTHEARRDASYTKAVELTYDLKAPAIRFLARHQ